MSDVKELLFKQYDNIYQDVVSGEWFCNKIIVANNGTQRLEMTVTPKHSIYGMWSVSVNQYGRVDFVAHNGHWDKIAVLEESIF